MTDRPALRVEAARPGDVPLILDMVRKLAAYEKIPHSVTATENDLHETLFGPQPAAEAAIGYVGDDPAGITVFFTTYSTFLARRGIYLEDIFVEEQHRGAGLGKALLAYVAHLAVERGCARLEWSVLNWNEPAIGFYRSLGANPMDEWTVYRLTGEPLDKLGRR